MIYSGKNRPWYVVTRTADGYQTVRVDRPARVKKLGWIIGGGVIGSCGLFRGGLKGVVMSLIGAAMVVHGLSESAPAAHEDGNCPECGKKMGAGAQAKSDGTRNCAAGMGEEQKLDEALSESFPASDPLY